MPDLVPVRVRDCAHPDAPHPEGDFVHLYPKIPLEGGIAAATDLNRIAPMVAAGMTVEDASDWLTARWLVTFVKAGYASGDIPLNELLADYDLGMPVADAANDLYAEAVMRPLAPRPSATSPSGPTANSTSATTPPT